MKPKRGLSKKYFDVKPNEAPRVFEDYDEFTQGLIIDNMDKKSLEVLCIKLADALNRIGDKFDIYDSQI